MRAKQRQMATERRSFLAQSCALAAATCVSAGTSTGRAIEPIQRQQPKFKYSMAAYSYRALLTREVNPLTLFDFVDDCAKFNLEGTELTSYYFPKDVSDRYCRRLKRHCFRHGLDISGTAVGNDFGHPSGPERDAQISAVKRWIERAEILGAPVIRIFAGHQRDGQSLPQLHDNIVTAIEECCRFAGDHGVHLALENHGGPTSTAEGLLALVRDIDSPWFGVNLDTGNFDSDDIYADLEQVAPYALNVQVKVAVAGPDGERRKTDYQRIRAILNHANYRGYVVLEFEEDGDPRQECPRHLEELRATVTTGS